MPRYFFHSANGKRQFDAEGLELSGVRAAEIEAVRFLGDLLSEQPDTLLSSDALTITVSDTNGQTVLSVRAGVLRNTTP